eukprot:CAMPEP_0185023636 /NCGR_PEP_ID=MMETSP1103-20130426/6283_1 /TAXON_ID=36769 /ORGANISM="Paraphysomonas bandaiensis, Strain Caron Lab Isolate" /LENGTH=129 /DNA_ID=CAMNT_0027556319 /DNA_START=134 /DNA_END=523 /DNA_ORIENTATION=+
MKFEAMAAARNSEELAAAANYKAEFDPKQLPENLKYFDSYVNSSSGAAQEPYVPNPKAWQNLPILSFVAQEYTRPVNIWLLIIGPLFYMYLVSYPGRAGWYDDEEMTKKSLYVQQLRGLRSNSLDDLHH